MSRGWKPKKKTVATGYGPRGQAKVLLSKSGKTVRVIFEDEELGQADVARKNCPDNIQTGNWIVSLGAKRDKVYSIRPIKGVFLGKFKTFTSEKEKPPAPKMDRWDRISFTTILIIMEGKEKGMEVPLTLPYWFYEDQDDEGRSVLGLEYHPKSTKNMALLEDLLEAA